MKRRRGETADEDPNERTMYSRAENEARNKSKKNKEKKTEILWNKKINKE